MKEFNLESLILEYFFLIFAFQYIKIIKVHDFWKGYKNLKKNLPLLQFCDFLKMS